MPDEQSRDNRHANATGSLSADHEPSIVMPRQWRFAISCLLVFHVLAIISAPLAMAPAAMISQTLFAVCQPYADALFLNHGYHFFAPEPGPAHVIRYEIETANGELVTGQFPDPDEHWPRLLYHRHFMLTETAGNMSNDPANDPLLATFARSLTEHLREQYRDESGRAPRNVRLVLRRHFIPSPSQVAGGMPLDAPELYAERVLAPAPLDRPDASPATDPVMAGDDSRGMKEVRR